MNTLPQERDQIAQILQDSVVFNVSTMATSCVSEYLGRNELGLPMLARPRIAMDSDVINAGQLSVF